MSRFDKNYREERRDGYGYYKRKKTNWSAIILVFIIAIVLIGYFTEAFDGVEKIKEVKDKIITVIKDIELRGSIPVETEIKEDLMDKCEKEFDYYFDIVKRKTGLPIKHIETKKINNKEEADEFEELWGVGLFQILSGSDIDNIKLYPVVMFAYRVNYKNGEVIPHVAVCGNDGKLMEKSKQTLLN